MNENTKLALIDFATAVQKIAVGVAVDLGAEEAGKICDAAETLKDSLRKDETLP